MYALTGRRKRQLFVSGGRKQHQHGSSHSEQDEMCSGRTGSVGTGPEHSYSDSGRIQVSSTGLGNTKY